MACGRHRVPGSSPGAPPRTRSKWEGTRTVQHERGLIRRAAPKALGAQPQPLLESQSIFPRARAPGTPGAAELGGRSSCEDPGCPRDEEGAPR